MTPEQESFEIIASVIRSVVVPIPFGEIGKVNSALNVIRRLAYPEPATPPANPPKKPMTTNKKIALVKKK